MVYDLKIVPLTKTSEENLVFSGTRSTWQQIILSRFYFLPEGIRIACTGRDDVSRTEMMFYAVCVYCIGVAVINPPKTLCY